MAAYLKFLLEKFIKKNDIIDITRRKPNPKPNAHGHDAMVYHVQGGDVACLLSEDEEELQSFL
jgi:hypothetical protein